MSPNQSTVTVPTQEVQQEFEKYPTRPLISYEPLEYVLKNGYKVRLRWFSEDPEKTRQFIDDYAPMFEGYYNDTIAKRHMKGEFGLDISWFLYEWAQAGLIFADIVAKDGKIAGFVMMEWSRVVFSSNFALLINVMYLKKEYRLPNIYDGMLDAIQAFAKKLQVDEVFVDCDTYREQNIEKYLRGKHVKSVYRIPLE